MLVRVHVTAHRAESRTIAVEWNHESRERNLLIRGAGLKRWPSAPEDEGDLDAVIRNVEARTPASGDSSRLGRTLFDALIGDSTWSEILVAADQTDHIELRLQWPVTDSVMNSQHWELLHDGTHFLSVASRRIAIVREIEAPAGVDRTQMWTRVDRPARVLFAVGSDLHDAAIRPAAEFLSLLRELGRSSNNLPRVRFVEAASLDSLSAAIAEFEPDALHLAAHGSAPASGPYVELRADDGNGSSEVTAAQLMPALRGGSNPPMVVLSACTTGRMSRTPEGLGVAIAPFACQLVGAGVPAVVGMSGDVTDRTCRLFARRFGSALVDGARLALAATDARRAAFQNQAGAPPETSVDWALPSLFVPSDMPPAYAPIELHQSKTARQRIESDYGISVRSRDEPVFAGRIGHLEVFSRVFGASEPGALLLHGPSGVGMNRLRDELAIFALCEGSPVVRVPVNAEYPQNYAAALLSILVATNVTRSAFGPAVDLPPGAVATHIVNSRLGAAIAALQDGEVEYAHVAATELDYTRWMLAVQREPLERFQGYETLLTRELLADLGVMWNDLQTRGPGGQTGPVVLDLPDLDKWGGATPLLFEHLLKPRLLLPGAGDDNRVRVLATYRDNHTETDEPGRLLREQAGPRVEVLSVDPFSPEEERVAIPWILLHPYGKWKEVIVPRHATDDDWYEMYRAAREFLGQNLPEPLKPAPQCFREPAFASTIDFLRAQSHLLTDEYSDASLLVGLGEAT